MSCSKKLGFLIWFDSIEGNVVARVVGLFGKPALKEVKSQKMSVTKNSVKIVQFHMQACFCMSRS